MKKLPPAEPIHEHHYVVLNPYHNDPAGDRCECGTFRYESMGPFHRRAARLREEVRRTESVLRGAR